MLALIKANPAWCHGVNHNFIDPWGLCEVAFLCFSEQGVDWLDDVELLRTKEGSFWFNNREERIAALKQVILNLR